MKQFTDFTDKIIEYSEHKKAASNNTSPSKWFNEFFEDTDDSEVKQKYVDAVDCATRSATKEMLDFHSEMVRNLNIRNKSRRDYFVSDIVRKDGVVFNLSAKKVRLNDWII